MKWKRTEKLVISEDGCDRILKYYVAMWILCRSICDETEPRGTQTNTQEWKNTVRKVFKIVLKLAKYVQAF